jgi:hypothetical protein
MPPPPAGRPTGQSAKQDLTLDAAELLKVSRRLLRLSKAKVLRTRAGRSPGTRPWRKATPEPRISPQG